MTMGAMGRKFSAVSPRAVDAGLLVYQECVGAEVA